MPTSRTAHRIGDEPPLFLTLVHGCLTLPAPMPYRSTSEAPWSKPTQSSLEHRCPVAPPGPRSSPELCFTRSKPTLDVARPNPPSFFQREHSHVLTRLVQHILLLRDLLLQDQDHSEAPFISLLLRSMVVMSLPSCVFMCAIHSSICHSSFARPRRNSLCPPHRYTSLRFEHREVLAS